MQPGITFIEVIITLIIISLVLAFSIPSFKNNLQQTRDSLLLDKMQQAMQLARREAIMRQVAVNLCGSEDQKSCSDHWTNGFIVTASNQILFSFHESNQSGVMHWRAFPFYVDQLAYLPSGQLSFENGTFWYCHDKPLWALIINQVGRVRVSYPDKNGEILDNKNKPLPC